MFQHNSSFSSLLFGNAGICQLLGLVQIVAVNRFSGVDGRKQEFILNFVVNLCGLSLFSLRN